MQATFPSEQREIMGSLPNLFYTSCECLPLTASWWIFTTGKLFPAWRCCDGKLQLLIFLLFMQLGNIQSPWQENNNHGLKPSPHSPISNLAELNFIYPRGLILGGVCSPVSPHMPLKVLSKAACDGIAVWIKKDIKLHHKYIVVQSNLGDSSKQAKQRTAEYHKQNTFIKCLPFLYYLSFTMDPKVP